MFNPLRSLFRRWISRSTLPISLIDPRAGKAKPRLVLLEDKLAPSTVAVTIETSRLAPTGAVTTPQTGDQFRFDSDTTPNSPDDVRLASGTAAVQPIAFYAPTGTVVNGSTSSQLINPDGTPAGTAVSVGPGAFVVTAPASGGSTSAISTTPTAQYQLNAAAAPTTIRTTSAGSGAAPFALLSPNDPPVAGPGANSITGFVFQDSNGNGQFDAGEPALAGVTVNLIDNGGNQVATTTTDLNGNYSFINLVDGTYSVVFDIASFPAAYVFTAQDAPGSTDLNDSDANPTTGQTAPISLAGGQVVANVDAGAFQPVIIGDIVFNDANGNGIQDAGEAGVSNVTVNLLDASGNVIATQLTDANGLYLFVNVTPGQYQVEFVAPAGFTISPQNQGSDDTLDSDADAVTGKTALTTYKSGDLTLDLDAGVFQNVGPVLGSIGDFVFFDANQNGIQDPGEFGVPNQKVNLYDAGGTLLQSTLTDADGKYLFGGLAAGSYSIEIVPTPAGWAFSPADQGADDALDSDVNKATGKTGLIALGAGVNLTNVDAGLTKPLTALVGDTVFLDLNGNGIQDAGESGVANVTVNLLDAGGNVVATQQTDVNGKYLFMGVTPGTYSVQFIAPAGFTFTLQDQGADDAVDSDANAAGLTGQFSVAAGQADITRDAGLISPLGAIGDYVFFDFNQDGIQQASEFGIPNVVVNLLDGSGNLISSTLTDLNGKYLFTGLAAGDYIVEFKPQAGFGFSPPNVGADDALDSDAIPATGRTGVITLAAGETNLTVDAGVTKTVTVVLGDFVWNDLNCDGIQQPNEPGVAGVTVNLLDAGGNVVATQMTDGNGKYLFTGVAPGTYSVQFILPAGFHFSPANQGGDDTTDSDADVTTGVTQTVTLAAGDVDLTLDAGLCQTASLGDFVWNDLNCDGIQDSGELGVPNVTVNLLDAGGNIIMTTTTDANGKYLFDDLMVGVAYTVQFIAPAGFIISPQNVGADDLVDSDADPVTGLTGSYVLSPGENNISVDAGLCIPMQKFKIGDFVWVDSDCDGIQDPGEAGVSGITVNLLDAAGNVIGTTLTDVNGAYLFQNLDAGTYSVEFVLPAGYAFTQSNAGANDALDSDADVTTGRTLTYTLLNADELTVDAGVVFIKNISGFVYVDANDNGIFDPGETPIANVIITLAGTNDLGQPVSITAKTDATGQYAFTNIRPGTYSLTETCPPGYLDGKDTLGTPFPGIVGNDVISNIQIDCDGSKINGVNYNFGEYLPSSIQGKVFLDLNNDGIPQPSEPGIAAVQVILTGTDSRGTVVSRTTYTNADGTYTFTGLRPGTYTVNEIQPSLFQDGLDRVGSVGGVLGNDVLSSIPLPFNTAAFNYDFGERLKGNQVINKEELLSSTTQKTPTLAGQSEFLSTMPSFANSISMTGLCGPTAKFVVIGSDIGQAPIVRVFDFGTGQLLYTITAYDASFRGGVRVASGDVTGDGVPDIITVAGVGGGPHVKVFDGSTGGMVAEFFAYDASFTGGVYVTTGDFNGDGVNEIATGAGEGGGSHVRVFTAGGALLNEFFAYGGFTGGVRVAAGDTDGNGTDELITAAGPGGGPHVKVYNALSSAVITEFFAFDAGFTGGVYVAAGDTDGDGRAEIIAGSGAGIAAQVRVFSATTLAQLYSFVAYGNSFTGGVRVGAVDTNGDGRAEVLATPGAGLPTFTRVVDVTLQSDLDSFLAFDNTVTGGAFINGG